jgi:hypothetical protein
MLLLSQLPIESEMIWRKFREEVQEVPDQPIRTKSRRPPWPRLRFKLNNIF